MSNNCVMCGTEICGSAQICPNCTRNATLTKDQIATVMHIPKVEKQLTRFEKYQNKVADFEELKEDLEIERESLLKEGICLECGEYMQSRKVAVETAMQPPEYEGFCPNCNFKEEEL